MYNWILTQYRKLGREVITYLIAGVLTTLFNYAVFFLLTRLTPLALVSSNLIAWATSVVFAYLTNRRWVFRSTANGWKKLLGEFAAFIGSRLFSGVADTTLMIIMVEHLNISDVISKLLVNVFVIIINYIFSKFLVFRKKP